MELFGPTLIRIASQARDQVKIQLSKVDATQEILDKFEAGSEKIELLHKMLLAAMKCKQTIDPTHVTTLRSLLKEFETLYFGHSLK